MPDYRFGSSNSFSYKADRSLINTSFLWMALGLLLTAATSYLFYSSQLFLRLLYTMPAFSLILALVQIGVVIAFTATMQKASATTMKVLFLVYAFTLGISMTSLAFVYNFGTISIAFLVSAVYFVCLAVIGFTTKRDMSKFGTLCLGGLVAMILTQLIMSLFGVGMDTRLISIIGLLMFTGLTAWDLQKLHHMSSLTLDGNTQEKLSIYFALQLYLDFINIFLYILRLLGSNNRN